jgi:hypothetical protein
MKRIVTLFGVAVMFVFAFSAVAAGTAAAEETKLLVEPTAANPITDTAIQEAPGHLLDTGGLEVKCAKGSGGETFVSANEGTEGTVVFKECTSSLSSKCTGEGEATSGQITAKGTVRFWLALLMMGKIGSETTELVAALVFLTKVVKFECVNTAKTFKAVVEVKPGCVASQVLPESLNKLVSKVHEVFEEWAPTETKGEQVILEVLPAGTTSEINCLLKVVVNSGAELLSAIVGLFFVEGFKHNEGSLTIELMNP